MGIDLLHDAGIQCLPQARYAYEDGYAATAQYIHDVGSAHGRTYGYTAAHDNGGYHTSHEWEYVVQWQEYQRTASVVEDGYLEGNTLDICPQVGKAEHYALWRACGSAGIYDDCCLVVLAAPSQCGV